MVLVYYKCHTIARHNGHAHSVLIPGKMRALNAVWTRVHVTQSEGDKSAEYVKESSVGSYDD